MPYSLIAGFLACKVNLVALFDVWIKNICCKINRNNTKFCFSFLNAYRYFIIKMQEVVITVYFLIAKFINVLNAVYSSATWKSTWGIKVWGLLNYNNKKFYHSCFFQSIISVLSYLF